MGLGAVVGAAPERKLPALTGRRERVTEEVRRRLGHPGPAAPRALELDHPRLRRAKRGEPCVPGAAEAAQRLGPVARRGEPVLAEHAGEARGTEVELLGVVEQQVVKAPPRRRMLAGQPQRIADEVALVAPAGLGEHPLVRAIDLGELALAGRVELALARARGG